MNAGSENAPWQCIDLGRICWFRHLLNDNHLSVVPYRLFCSSYEAEEAT